MQQQKTIRGNIKAAFEVKELKAASRDGVNYGSFSGYASVFNYADRDADVVEQGAFRKSLQSGRKIKMLWQHSWAQPIGTFPVAREDTLGLYVEGEINLDVRQGAEAYSLLKQGAIDAMSIGFSCKDFEFDSTLRLRRIKEVDLYEVSLVTFPANEAALVGDVKSMVQISDISTMTQRDFERLLREEYGASNSEARTIAEKGFKDFAGHRDDVSKADAAGILTMIKQLKGK
jgi:HK97 family phage prohead protease